MQNDESDNEGGGRGAKNKKKGFTPSRRGPTAQNEINLYDCPVSDLEKKIDIHLDFDAVGKATVVRKDLTKGGVVVKDGESDGMKGEILFPLDDLHLAGHIKSHLIPKQTLVIKSSATTTTQTTTYSNLNTTNTNNTNSPLLDEGSYLFLKASTDTDGELITKSESTAIDNNKNNSNSDGNDGNCRVIPLGKVLELFGPVSRPLYMVRLKEVSKLLSNGKVVDYDLY